VPEDKYWGHHWGHENRSAVVMGLRSLRVHRFVFAHTGTLTGDVTPPSSASLASTSATRREVLPHRCRVDRANHLCGGIDCMSIGLVMLARLVERGLCGKS
jgi:hypothetical protein